MVIKSNYQAVESANPTHTSVIINVKETGGIFCAGGRNVFPLGAVVDKEGKWDVYYLENENSAPIKLSKSQWTAVSSDTSKPGLCLTNIYAQINGREYTCKRYASIAEIDYDYVKIMTSHLPDAKVGDEYEARIDIESTDTYYVTVSGLPSGLRYESSMQRVLGTPQSYGVYKARIKATTAKKGLVDEVVLTLNIKRHQIEIVTESNLPMAILKKEYHTYIVASNVEGSVTWSIGNVAELPVKIEPAYCSVEGYARACISAEAGAISTTDKLTFSVKVVDGNGNSDTKLFAINVNGKENAPVIATTELATALEGIEYEYQLKLRESVPVEWSWGDDKPALEGLYLNPVTGLINGIASKADTYKLKVVATSLVDSTKKDTKEFTLNVIEVPVIITQSLPDAYVDEEYSVTLDITDKSKTTTWATSELPEGLTLNPQTGVISGTPVSGKIGRYSIKATVTEVGTKISASKTFVLYVKQLPIITTEQLEPAYIGVAYEHQLQARAIGNVRWSIAPKGEERLPEGIDIDEVTGLLSGICETNGTYNLIITATSTFDTGEIRAMDKEYAFVVKTTPAIITVSKLDNAIVGRPYSAAIHVSGFGKDVQWHCVDADNLPSGLVFSSSKGIISGVASLPGSYHFTIECADEASGISDRKQFSLTVISPPRITTIGSLPVAYTGQEYQTDLSAVGTPPFAWSIPEPSKLPEGLSIDPSSGTITGTPTQDQIYSFEAKVSNDAGCDFSLFKLEVITPTSLPSFTLPLATYNQRYFVQLKFEGKAPYQWTMTAEKPGQEIPEGININQTTGEIYGIPTKTGRYSFVITAYSASGTISRVTKLNVGGKPYIKTRGELATGKVGQNYELPLVCESLSEVRWGWGPAGMTPPGLEVRPTAGKIVGKPTEAGKYEFHISARNAEYGESRENCSMTITENVMITTTKLDNGNVNESYEFHMAANRPADSLLWDMEVRDAADDRILTDVLDIDINTGVITSKAAEGIGYYEDGLKVKVTAREDTSIGSSDTKDFVLLINPKILTEGFPNPVKDEQYDAPIDSIPESKSLRWEVAHRDSGGDLRGLHIEVDETGGARLRWESPVVGDLPIIIQAQSKSPGATGALTQRQYTISVTRPALKVEVAKAEANANLTFANELEKSLLDANDEDDDLNISQVNPESEFKTTDWSTVKPEILSKGPFDMSDRTKGVAIASNPPSKYLDWWIESIEDTETGKMFEPEGLTIEEQGEIWWDDPPSGTYKIKVGCSNAVGKAYATFDVVVKDDKDENEN